MKALFPALVLAALAAPAAAASLKAGDLTIESPWARATPKGAEVGAGYVAIRNDGAAADRLTGISVDFADVQVHEMKMVSGVMQMRTAEAGLDIPAHRTVKLAPGGYHLMFMNLKHPLVKGETVKATMTFAHAGKVAVDFPVLGIGSAGPDAKR